MGEFVTASAFRTEDSTALTEAIRGFFAAHSWPTADIAEPSTEDDVLIYPPKNGWTTVMWPAYFTELAAVEHISRVLGVLASTVAIHDGDYWRHVLWQDGVVLDRFAGIPDYFTDDEAEVARLSAKYRGQPAIVAEAVGVSVEQIAPYLVQIVLEEEEDEEPELGRAFPDDEFELDSPWVFVDFWRRLGPGYPDDLSAIVAGIRLAPGWLRKLPVGDAEL